MSDTTGRLVLTVGGQLLGAALGGPLGAIAGSVVGSALGSAVFPADPIYGPRLTDSRVGGASYGASLPFVVGVARVPGQIVWVSAIREQEVNQSAGKGGGPSVTNFYYYRDVAVALCEGPIAGVRRMWADGKLVYDGTATAGASAVAASQQYINDRVTVYIGDEAQLADPTIEAALGAGNAPAYRGTAYVMFRDLVLTDFGNRIPNLTFEVVTSATLAGPRRLASGTAPFAWGGAARPLITSIDGAARITDWNASRTVVHALTGAPLLTEGRDAVDAAYFPVLDSSTLALVMPTYDGGRMYASLGSAGAEVLRVVYSAGSPVNLAAAVVGAVGSGNRWCAIWPCADRRHFVVLTRAGSVGAPTAYVVFRYLGTGAPSVVRSGTISGSYGFNAIGSAGWGFAYATAQQAGMLDSDLVSLWTVTTNSGAVALATINTSTNVLTAGTVVFTGGDGVAATVDYCSIFADSGICVAVGGSTVAVYTRGNALDVNSVPLQTALGRILDQCGVSASQRDLSAVSGFLNGYLLAQQGTGRAALEPLLAAYQLMALESEGKLVVRPLTAEIQATIPADDLAEREDGVFEPQVTREDLGDLPSTIQVRYYALSADFQEGLQAASRKTLANPVVETIELPLALTDAAAADLAQSALFRRHLSAQKVTFATGPKWAHYEPGDVLSVPVRGRALAVRVLKQTIDGSLVSFDGEVADANVASQTGAAGTTNGAGTVTALTPTRMLLLDLPPLRDVDDAPGLYVVAAGYAAGWPGAAVFRSADSGATYDQVVGLGTAGTIGVAATVLGNWAGGNTVDEANSVNVTLLSGALSSCTQAQLYDGVNTCVLGGEILSFRDATLVSGTTYRLRGFIRGRKGTERGMTSHAANEFFALLNGAVVWTPNAAADINQARLYKPVTLGRTLEVTTPQSFTSVGASVLPLAPVNLFIARGAANLFRIHWTRRGRIDAEWRDSVDVPLAEASELYDVEIWNAGNSVVLRTFSNITAQFVDYASAQYTADFGAEPVQINVRVYQRSAVAGRGWPAIRLLAVPPLTVNPFEDTFDSDTSASYTNSSDTGATWTWDTANSRVTATGGSQSLRVRADFSGADCFVECDTDRLDDGALVLRHQDNNNYYLLVMRDSASAVPAAASTWQFFRRVGGTFTLINSGSLSGGTAFTRGVNSTIRFAVSGTSFSATINGNAVFTGLADATITLAGRVGMRQGGTGTNQYLRLKWG